MRSHAARPGKHGAPGTQRCAVTAAAAERADATGLCFPMIVNMEGSHKPSSSANRDWANPQKQNLARGGHLVPQPPTTLRTIKSAFDSAIGHYMVSQGGLTPPPRTPHRTALGIVMIGGRAF